MKKICQAITVICLFAAPVPCFAQPAPTPVGVTDVPFGWLPGPNPFPVDARLLFPPPKIHFPDPPSPTLQTHFIAVVDGDTNITPITRFVPDVAGAVSSNFVVAVHNSYFDVR